MNTIEVHTTEKGYMILHATKTQPHDFGVATNEWANSEDELMEVLRRLGLTEAAIGLGLLEMKEKGVAVFPV